MGVFEIISLIFGVIMAGAGIASQAVANNQNIEQNNLNREDTQQFNSQEAAIARQANIDQYNLLHSPQAKVKQYREAGLSPALMYSGGGAASAGGTTQMASAGMAGTPTINPIIPQSSMLDLLQQKSEIDLTKEDTKLKAKQQETIDQQIKESEAVIKKYQSEVDLNEVIKTGQDLQNSITANQKKISDATVQEQIDIIKNNKVMLDKAIDKTTKEVNLLEIEEKKKEEILDATIKKMKAEAFRATKEAYLAAEQTLLARAEKYLTDEKRKLTISERNEVNEKVRILKVQANKIESAPWSAESNGWIDKLINIGIDGLNEFDHYLKDKTENIGKQIQKGKNWLDLEMHDPNHLIH